LAEVNIWTELHGFASPGEFDRFATHIDQLVASGEVREIEVDGNYGRGEIYGGRWFMHVDTGSCWRLVPPDPPFRGLWECIDP
jgi:hypothetical protein